MLLQIRSTNKKLIHIHQALPHGYLLYNIRNIQEDIPHQEDHRTWGKSEIHFHHIS